MANHPPSGRDDPGSDRRAPRSAGIQSFEFSFNVSLPSGPIEPDSDMDEVQDSSASLSESVQNYPEEFGRTYHAYRAGSYAFPNDAIEQERLALQNSALTKLFGNKLYFAPLTASNPPKTILDVATGTGDWAIEMGDLFPQAQITATDLSPIQPEDVPPNVNFFVEDSSEPWEYSEKFDYIHTRSTAGCWSSFEEQVARQAFEALNPGGYFESQELDSSIACDDETIPEGSAMLTWFHDLSNAGQMLNRPTIIGRHLKDIYERVGFVDVEERIFKMPTNVWPKDPALKELGRIWEKNLLQGLSGFSFRMFNRAYGRTPAEIEVSLVDVRRELSDPRIHAYMPIWVVWGRKPHPNEE